MTERGVSKLKYAINFLNRTLRVPVVFVVLRGYDDYHGEDGAQHNGGDANSQADEGEVACFTRGYFCRHHVPSGNRRTHLSDAGGWGGR